MTKEELLKNYHVVGCQCYPTDYEDILIDDINVEYSNFNDTRRDKYNKFGMCFWMYEHNELGEDTEMILTNGIDYVYTEQDMLYTIRHWEEEFEIHHFYSPTMTLECLLRNYHLIDKEVFKSYKDQKCNCELYMSDEFKENIMVKTECGITTVMFTKFDKVSEVYTDKTYFCNFNLWLMPTKIDDKTEMAKKLQELLEITRLKTEYDFKVSYEYDRCTHEEYIRIVSTDILTGQRHAKEEKICVTADSNLSVIHDVVNNSKFFNGTY